MISEIVRNYKWLKMAAGAELELHSDGSYTCYCCCVTIGKDAITITKKIKVNGDLRDVLKILPKDRHVAITLTGRGSLVKKVEIPMEGKGGFLTQLLPNLNVDRFYIQHYKNGSAAFVSFCTKKLIQSILDLAAAQNIDIVLLTGGPFAVVHILSQLNIYGEELLFNGHLVKYNAEFEWTDYSYQSGLHPVFQLKIGGEVIEDHFLIAYSTAFQIALYPYLPVINLPVKPLEGKVSELEQKMKFKVRVVGVVILFMAAFSVNEAVINYYDNQNKKLREQVKMSSLNNEMFQKTEIHVRTAEQNLMELGWAKGVSKAWLADQIGVSLPEAIVLDELIINPEESKDSEFAGKPVYKVGKIIVKGDTLIPESVNEWIQKLKKQPWVKDVVLNFFSDVNQEDKQKFVITINY